MRMHSQVIREEAVLVGRGVRGTVRRDGSAEDTGFSLRRSGKGDFEASNFLRSMIVN